MPESTPNPSPEKSGDKPLGDTMEGYGDPTAPAPAEEIDESSGIGDIPLSKDPGPLPADPPPGGGGTGG